MRWRKECWLRLPGHTDVQSRDVRDDTVEIVGRRSVDDHFARWNQLERLLNQYSHKSRSFGVDEIWWKTVNTWRQIRTELQHFKASTFHERFRGGNNLQQCTTTILSMSMAQVCCKTLKLEVEEVEGCIVKECIDFLKNQTLIE
jgi:hypothetical protein